MPQVSVFSLPLYNKFRQALYGSKNPDHLEKSVLVKIEILERLMIQRVRRSERRILKRTAWNYKRAKSLQN